MKAQVEFRKRTILKTLTMKALEITTSGIILQIIFKTPIVSLSLPFLLELAQLGVYYLHERVWARVSYGKECEGCHYKNFHEKQRINGEEHD